MDGEGWEALPGDSAPLASSHRGTCRRCKKRLAELAAHQILEEVAEFTEANSERFVGGMDPRNRAAEPRPLGLHTGPLLQAED